MTTFQLAALLMATFATSVFISLWFHVLITAPVRRALAFLGAISLSELFATGCAGTAHSQSTPSGQAWMFRSQGWDASGHAFYEAGLHIAQPDGSACTISTMVFEGGSKQDVNTCPSGSNNWHCNSVGDCSTSVTSSDGSLIWGAGITGSTIWYGEARKQ